MSKVDNAIHTLFELKNDMRFHPFSDVGIDEPWYDYYYAEDRLYIVRDVMMDQYWFVEASSPGDALYKFKETLQEMMNAGKMVDEEEY